MKGAPIEFMSGILIQDNKHHEERITRNIIVTEAKSICMNNQESQDSLMVDEDEDFIRKAMYIMFAWVIIVVAAGALLILLRDPLTGLFAMGLL